MQQILNKKNLFLGVIFSGLFWTEIAKAVCPICVVAIGGGLGFSRWLGIDDTITSIWIGALLVALSLWTTLWLEIRDWKFTYYKAITWLSYYVLVLVPLYYYGIIGHPLNTVFNIDKIVFGTVLGTVVFMLSYWFHGYLKVKNGGKSYFPYQKVVLPLLFLILTSLLFYLLIAWKII